MTSTPTVSTNSTAPIGVVFGSTPGMPRVFKSNFDYQFLRAMCAGSYGDGGAVGECFSTARRVVDGDIESWTVAWSDTAQRVEAIAEDCLRAGHTVSARGAFLRASMYWNTAFFYLEHSDPRQLEMYTRHRSSFRQAATLFDTPIEPVSIPYENGKTLPGYFMRADADGCPRPTVMILGGGDTTCEELFYWGGGAAAVRRGYNAFLWEGPGQVGAYALDPELTYRPDWEVPTRYAVDYALSRGDVDAERLALTGHSMGGYFAPRAAAYEKRITAVVANSLLPELKPLLMPLINLVPDVPSGEDLDDKADLSNPLTKMVMTAFRDRFGMTDQSLAAMWNKAGTYSLAGLEEHITCPFLSLAGDGEGSQVLDAGHEFYEKLTCPKAERIFRSADGGDAHCQMNNPSLKHQVEFDWLGEIFN